MKQKKIILLLGGNSPDTFKIIENALHIIQKEVGTISCYSSYYTSEAWGPIKQPDFINIVVIIKTSLPPVFLLKKILTIENRLGRKRTIKYGPRTIDIDILFYHRSIIHHKDLIVPHPEIANRRFVLLPCNEIVPNFIHPQLRQSIHQLLQSCNDKLEVKKWN